MNKDSMSDRVYLGRRLKSDYRILSSVDHKLIDDEDLVLTKTTNSRSSLYNKRDTTKVIGKEMENGLSNSVLNHVSTPFSDESATYKIY